MIIHYHSVFFSISTSFPPCFTLSFHLCLCWVGWGGVWGVDVCPASGTGGKRGGLDHTGQAGLSCHDLEAVSDGDVEREGGWKGREPQASGAAGRSDWALQKGRSMAVWSAWRSANTTMLLYVTGQMKFTTGERS